MPPLPLSGRDLTIDNVIEVARGRRAVELEPAAARRMADARSVIERLVADGASVYGVTTGFGDLADVRIEPSQTAELQQNLVRSHAAGVGDPLPDEVVRAMLVLRANTLAVGLSGVRIEVADNGSGKCSDLAASPSTGVGLANIRDRLTQAYGPAHGFTTRENDKGGFSVIVEIPYETGDRDS